MSRDWIDELVTQLPHVYPAFVEEVREMGRTELQRRVLIGSDWQGAFMCSLDGIPAISCMAGSGIDGCRSYKEVRSIVEQLLEVSPKTWEKTFLGTPVPVVAGAAEKEIADLRAQLAEADRRAGQAERKLERVVEEASRRQQWLAQAKRAWGVDDHVSFDVVWKEALELRKKDDEDGISCTSKPKP